MHDYGMAGPQLRRPRGSFGSSKLLLDIVQGTFFSSSNRPAVRVERATEGHPMTFLVPER
jgi:hypothetical protein